MSLTQLVDLSDAALARVQLEDEIGRARGNAESLVFLAQTALAARHPDLAVLAAEQALGLVREEGSRQELAAVLALAGATRAVVGDHAAAVRHLIEGRGLAEEHDDELGVAAARLKLAYCFAMLHDVERAREHLEAALPKLPSEPLLAADVENARGAIASAVGDHAAAEASKLRLAALLPSRTDQDAARQKVRLAAAVHNGGDRARARRLLEEAIPVLETASDKPALAQALEGLGVIERQEGRPEAAIAIYERGARLAREVGENGRAARFVLLRGYCLVQLGMNRDAVTAFTTAAGLFEKRGETFDEADARWSLGLAFRNLREAEPASKSFAKAAELYWALDMDEKAAACEKEIEKLRKKPGR